MMLLDQRGKGVNKSKIQYPQGMLLPIFKISLYSLEQNFHLAVSVMCSSQKSTLSLLL